MNLPASAGDVGTSLGWEDPLEKEMATLSSILPGNPMGRGAWQAKVHGVTKSRPQVHIHAHKISK